MRLRHWKYTPEGIFETAENLCLQQGCWKAGHHSVFTTPPGHQWRAAVMFLTYVSHSKCVRGCWWGEVQQRRSEARQTHTVMPAVLEHFECGLCIAVVNAGSLSSDLCLTSHLPPLLGYVSSISTPEKKHSPSSIGDRCLFFFRGRQLV